MKQITFKATESVNINEVDDYNNGYMPYYGGEWVKYSTPTRTAICLIDGGYVMRTSRFLIDQKENTTTVFKTIRELMEYYHTQHDLEFYAFNSAEELLGWMSKDESNW